MIWGWREFLAQFKPQGLGWDLSTVLCTELSTKKRVTWKQWLVIHYVLGCEWGVNSSSALPSAWILVRTASGWPGGRKLLLGSAGSRSRLMVLGWPLCQGIFFCNFYFLWEVVEQKTLCWQVLWFSAKSLLLMPLWMNSGAQGFFSETETQQFLSSTKTYQWEQRAVWISVNNTSTSTGRMWNNMGPFSATQTAVNTTLRKVAALFS